MTEDTRDIAPNSNTFRKQQQPQSSTDAYSPSAPLGIAEPQLSNKQSIWLRNAEESNQQAGCKKRPVICHNSNHSLYLMVCTAPFPLVIAVKTR